MCTLLSLTREAYERAPDAVERRIMQDAIYNRDGWSLVLSGNREEDLILRAMKPDIILSMLAVMPWERFFLHARAATQGSAAVTNTHAWTSRSGVIYMHNGVLRSKHAAKFPVDSQLIGQWLDEGGVKVALRELKNEPFANVFLISPRSGFFVVSRSMAGPLHTDGHGNYSTGQISDLGVTLAVRPLSTDMHPLTPRAKAIATGVLPTDPPKLEGAG